MKKKYALIGASCRALYMFAMPLINELKDSAEIVALYDVNPLRMKAFNHKLGFECPIYTDFNEMIADAKPDCAIITTVDRFHHEYICRSLNAGIDAITEKPMTIDHHKCLQILETEKRTGKKVTVTFNYRFTPYVTAVEQTIKDGMIGDILNVDFEYMLDTIHGASYFRRWHSRKENSGGLLVHKSTHHFDLINWWIEEEPVEVMAFGTQRFYGPNRVNRGKRCLTCEHKSNCEFYWDINKDEFSRDFYLNCESADGYIRDQSIFREDIDIEDTMSVNVKYNKGAVLSYSLIAHCPWEGWKVSINGTKGRLEAAEYHTGSKQMTGVAI